MDHIEDDLAIYSDVEWVDSEQLSPLSIPFPRRQHPPVIQSSSRPANNTKRKVEIIARPEKSARSCSQCGGTEFDEHSLQSSGACIGCGLIDTHFHNVWYDPLAEIEDEEERGAERRAAKRHRVRADISNQKRNNIKRIECMVNKKEQNPEYTHQAHVSAAAEYTSELATKLGIVQSGDAIRTYTQTALRVFYDRHRKKRIRWREECVAILFRYAHDISAPWTWECLVREINRQSLHIKTRPDGKAFANPLCIDVVKQQFKALCKKHALRPVSDTFAVLTNYTRQIARRLPNRNSQHFGRIETCLNEIERRRIHEKLSGFPVEIRAASIVFTALSGTLYRDNAGKQLNKTTVAEAAGCRSSSLRRCLSILTSYIEVEI